MLARVFDPIYLFIKNALAATVKFVTDLLGYLFQKLIDFLKALFTPLFLVIAMLFYFVMQLATLIWKLILVLVGIGKIFVSLVVGIFKTLAGISFTSAPRQDGKWTSIFENVVGGLDYFQLETISYILLFIIWFSTAFAGLRIITSMRGGGE